MRRIGYFFGLLFLASFMAVNFTSCEAPREDKFVGLILWSVRADMMADPKGTLEQVGEMGYKYIEGSGYQNGRFYGMEPEEFTAYVESCGMEFISSHIGRDLPTEENYEAEMEWWRRAIDAHARAGVKYIIQPYMEASALESLESLQEWVDFFHILGEMTNARGIKFGFHNHAVEFTEVEGVVVYDYLLQNTDPDLVFFQIDLYWIEQGGGDAIDYFRRYPGRFLMFHVKDKEEVGGSGTMDFQPYFEHAELAGMKYYIVEVEQYNYEPIESVRISLDYLLDADYVLPDYR